MTLMATVFWSKEFRASRSSVSWSVASKSQACFGGMGIITNFSICDPLFSSVTTTCGNCPGSSWHELFLLRFLVGLAAAHRFDAAQERKPLRHENGIPTPGECQVLIQDLGLWLAQYREIVGGGEGFQVSLSVAILALIEQVLLYLL